MKIISNKLYNEYTKTTIDYHTDYSKITKEQLYDTFKFHCQGQRILNEVVEYIYKLIQQDKEIIGNDKEWRKKKSRRLYMEVQLKSAREMFEELGYFQRDKDTFIEYVKIYDRNDSFTSIQFIHEDKMVVMCIIEDYEKVLKAINKQVEELGWNKWKEQRQ